MPERGAELPVVARKLSVMESGAKGRRYPVEQALPTRKRG